MEIINGKELAQKIRLELKLEVENLRKEGIVPKLAVIMVGDDVDGILLQSPIPKHLDINKAFRAILPEKDVDGFHPINAGKLSIGEECFIPCTPARSCKNARRI